MPLSLVAFFLVQLSVADVRLLAPPVEGERWPSLEIRAAAPVEVWTTLGLQPGDKVQLFNSHAMDVTTAESFYAWSVSPSTPAGIAFRRGATVKWIQHRVGRDEQPRIRTFMQGSEMAGIEVVSVPASAFWASAGLKAGDIIVAVNGIELNNPMALLMAFNTPAQKFRIRRAGKEFDLETVPGSPSSATEPVTLSP